MDDLNKYLPFLGAEISVTIDRPLGSLHPTLQFPYETNYGYVPKTVAGDGREIDAYVLGVDEPLQHYTGTCIAIIMRRDDNEHKLVVCHAPMTEHEILEKTAFVEAHYDTEVLLYDGHEEG